MPPVLPVEPPPNGFGLLIPLPSGSFGTINGAMPRDVGGRVIADIPAGFTRIVFGSTEGGFRLSTFGAFGTGPVSGQVPLASAWGSVSLHGITVCAQVAPVLTSSTTAVARYLFINTSMARPAVLGRLAEEVGSLELGGREPTAHFHWYRRAPLDCRRE
jgi:hypothetical protein